MKKLFIICMVLFMLLSIVACSGEGEPVQVPEEGQEQAAGETDEPEQSQETDLRRS